MDRGVLTDPVSISIHAPARGATKTDEKLLSGIQFQSTHPRGVRQKCNDGMLERVGISIHAPARGATKTYYFDGSIDIISIHAPARGATYCGNTGDAADVVFQSTHPRGVRHWRDPNEKCKKSISIHAPARGATQGGVNFFFGGGISIHAPARGATPCIARGTGIFLLHFNPRTREGCDRRPSACGYLKFIFQSTHPRGVRRNTISL